MTSLPCSSMKQVQQALSDLARGQPVLVFDDETRENEGDLILAAQHATPEAINFMITHGKGLVCLALTPSQINHLGLPLMEWPGHERPTLGTAFTVSIGSKSEVTTGISAADRAHTIRLASDPKCNPDKLICPGHIFPLRAQPGGVIQRAGHTESAVDLTRLAGLTPAGVTCEVIDEHGVPARTTALRSFAQKHQLCLVTVKDLIYYRLSTEKLVWPTQQTPFLDLQEEQTRWVLHEFDSALPDISLAALVRTQKEPSSPPLCLFSIDPKGSAALYTLLKRGEASTLFQEMNEYCADILLLYKNKSDAHRGISSPPSLASDSLSPLSDSSSIDPTKRIQISGLEAQVLRHLSSSQIRLREKEQVFASEVESLGIKVIGS
ncbi:3,4-dihydroxy-2-butanone-4-phosphate synthase [Pajaroellobacter abortibovis]|uniref:3,4-dihydroxy-2-butanone 4-phosphate synthase n=1 Tax=Pajaroellobacter abortibovis TaxID=1882918 RepID=A0A1L6MVF8_9BACT|nr:3,4-dihydroxy-2-butanone-4-phosphate synthase [Pajaroellobacter abortibovis]APR99530.1 3,4-dihydroxy-2-butanone-4-phosphate synthase [Pajaroellobacter abortibovis]